ncbi:MAG TPA: hypothetical protein VEB19_17285 [Gemmatimonadaceae bacterium]|nr:hypothetical protein [Gemmatimonadaceae bacterium]
MRNAAQRNEWRSRLLCGGIWVICLVAPTSLEAQGRRAYPAADTTAVRVAAAAEVGVDSSRITRSIEFRHDTAWVPIRYGDITERYLRVELRGGRWQAIGMEAVEAFIHRKPPKDTSTPIESSRRRPY